MSAAGIPGFDSAATPASGAGHTHISSQITDLSTSTVIEGTNLYFTNARVLSSTLTGFSALAGGVVAATDTALAAFQKLEYRTALNDAKVSWPGTVAWVNVSGVPTATGAQAGILSAADWTTFNNKQAALSFPLSVANGGTALAALGTANQLPGVNAGGTALEYKTVQGTANQVTVTHAAGSVTLATPQNIHAGASPTFAGGTYTGAVSITGSADAVQLQVKGNATQTANIRETRNSANVLLESLSNTGAYTVVTISVTGLTSGRVPFVGVGGLFGDSSGFIFDGTNLKVSGGFVQGLGANLSTWSNNTIYPSVTNGSFGLYGSSSALTGLVIYGDTHATKPGIAEFLSGCALRILSNVASTSPSTGALVVTSGAGIGGSTFIGGNLGVGTSADGQGHYIQITGNTITDKAPFISFFRSGAREFIQGIASNGIFIFANTGGGTGYTDAALLAAANLCITSLGKIGINTTAPSAVLEVLGDIKSTSPTAGIGYGTGAGGAVTQATSKATGVTLNTVCGTITLNNASLAANTSVAFTLTDSAIAATDLLVIVHDSVGTLGAYGITATPAAGSATITVRNNTAGALSEAIVLRFALIKAVVA